MDRSQSRIVLAAAIREAFSDLFAINTKANELPVEEVRNKLRTLYAGKKTDNVIKLIANTFAALSEYADFSKPVAVVKPEEDERAQSSEQHADKAGQRGIQTVAGAVSLD